MSCAASALKRQLLSLASSAIQQQFLLKLTLAAVFLLPDPIPLQSSGWVPE